LKKQGKNHPDRGMVQVNNTPNFTTGFVLETNRFQPGIAKAK